MELDVASPCRFESIGLGLTIWSGRFENTDGQWLRWTDTEGVVIPTGAERAVAAEEEMEKSKQAAADAVRENTRLLHLLRQHNIER